MTYSTTILRESTPTGSKLRSASLLGLALLLAGTLPTVLTYSVMWVGCRINCTALGWHAITYAPTLAYLVTSSIMAPMGMCAFHADANPCPPTRLRRLQMTYIGYGTLGILIMAAGPYTPPFSEYLAKLTARIVLSI